MQAVHLPRRTCIFAGTLSLFPSPVACADKGEILVYLREAAAHRPDDETLERADHIARTNARLASARRHLLADMEQGASLASWSAERRMAQRLLIIYASHVVGVECRHRIRPYDYMDLSRRSGELWEELVRQCLDFPLRADAAPFAPPSMRSLMATTEKRLLDEIADYGIKGEALDLVMRHAALGWELLNPDSVSLELDAHICVGSQRYCVDFKGGFGSNEKGNTARLSTIARAYKLMTGEPYECVLLVRDDAAGASHYLDALQRGGLWAVHHGTSALHFIGRLSGFPLAAWMQEYATWSEDIDPQAWSDLATQKIDRYLAW